MRPRRSMVSMLVVPMLLAAACGSDGPASPGPAPSAPATFSRVDPVPNEGWAHVPEGVAVAYRHNPPASGPHWPVWARYEAFTQVLPRELWVHNLEHGALIFLHRPDAPSAVLAALREAYRTLPADPQCGHARALLTPDPLLATPVAVVAADWVLESDGVDTQAIRDFVLAHRNRAPEDVCSGGSRP